MQASGRDRNKALRSNCSQAWIKVAPPLMPQTLKQQDGAGVSQVRMLHTRNSTSAHLRYAKHTHGPMKGSAVQVPHGAVHYAS
eukprot:1137809-Pelagomonas_calceolata.AAC.2